MTQHSGQQQLEQIAQEHKQLIEMITSLRTWLSEVAELGIARFGEMSDRLHPLLDKLIVHFEHEEEQGDLSNDLSASPKVVRGLAELHRDHSILREGLESLIHQLRDSETPFSSWEQACDRFETLCAELAHHESSEMELQKAARQQPPPDQRG